MEYLVPHNNLLKKGERVIVTPVIEDYEGSGSVYIFTQYIPHGIKQDYGDEGADKKTAERIDSNEIELGKIWKKY